MVDPILKKKRRLRARFWASESGVSALEFALVAPFFLILLGGIGVGGQFLTSTRHTAAIASTIGNLATQVQTLHDTDVADIFAVGQVLIAPIVSEKATMAAEKHNQVLFKVMRDATKPEIKASVEGIFGVKVTAVNTLIQKGKVKRFRGRIGVRTRPRRAV